MSYDSKNYQKRWDKAITLFSQERYDGDWMPAFLSDAIAWLQEYLDRVPAEWRDRATIEIDSTSGYENSHYATITISYKRPETDEEWATRLAGYEREQALQDEKDRRTYLALKARFDD